MEIIHYPVKGRKLEDVITQNTLNQFVSGMEQWRQGAGVIGRLNLHSCWGTASVLDKRYQGETASIFMPCADFFMEMYDRFRSPKWKIMTDALISHIFYLQDENGGFIHSTAEFEPTFDTRGCPIHFFSPIIALCRYYQWEHADPLLRDQIPGVIERHWNFTLGHSWKVGNGRFHPLTNPGWCAVTNQDLTAIAATVLVGKTLGKWDYFEEYGKPVLDRILSPAYYYEELGLFERGDGVNFPERLPYYNVILDRLEIIYDATHDERIPPVIDNIVSHLFNLPFVAPDGMTHLSRGINPEPDDRTKIKSIDRSSIPFNSYPGIILNMQKYLTRHPDPEKAAVLERVKDTLAAYVFADGCIPMAFYPANPLFTVVSTLDFENYLQLILNVLEDKMEEPTVVPMPTIHRQYKDFAWKQKGSLWAIEKDGVRQYGGFARYVGGITVGPDEKAVWGDYATLEDCDVLEIIDTEIP